MDYLLLVLCAVLWFSAMRITGRLKEKLPPRQPDFLRRGFLLFALAYLLILLIRSLAVEASADEAEPEATSFLAYGLQLMTLVMAGVCGAFIALIAATYGRKGLDGFGFTFKRPGLLLLFAAGAYVSFFPLYYLVCRINNLVVGHEPQEIVQEIVSNPELLHSFVVVSCAGLFIPLLEEILFRGFLLSGLKEYVRPGPAVILSAVIFAFVHETSAILPVFVLGCLLGYLKERTGSLLPAMAVHTIHNCLMLIFIPILV